MHKLEKTVEPSLESIISVWYRETNLSSNRPESHWRCIILGESVFRIILFRWIDCSLFLVVKT